MKLTWMLIITLFAQNGTPLFQDKTYYWNKQDCQKAEKYLKEHFDESQLSGNCEPIEKEIKDNDKAN